MAKEHVVFAVGTREQASEIVLAIAGEYGWADLQPSASELEGPMGTQFLVRITGSKQQATELTGFAKGVHYVNRTSVVKPIMTCRNGILEPRRFDCEICHTSYDNPAEQAECFQSHEPADGPTVCTKCDAEIKTGFMCDRDSHGIYCESCFETATGCTEEAHGEDCRTRVDEA